MRTEIENELLGIINCGCCEGFGDVDSYGKYVSLVEDVDDMDYVVTLTSFGLVFIDGPHTHVEIDKEGYYQPARRIFEELREEWEAWLDPGEDVIWP